MWSVMAFVPDLRASPKVKGAVRSNADLTLDYGVGSHLMKSPTGETVNANLSAISAGYGFIEGIGVEFLFGRDFDKRNPEEKAVLINESAMNLYGWQNAPLKAKYLSRDRQGSVSGEWNVVGVISDFKMGESYSMPKPLIIFLDDRDRPEMSILVNIEQQEPIAFAPTLGTIWEEHFNDYTFEFELLSDRLARLYTQEETFQELLSILSLLTIFITVLGVIGLISFTTEVRKKEIAIRKINGAMVENILAMISKQFAFLMTLALCLAIPVGYLLSNKWLENYSLHTELTILPLAITVLLCILFTIAAVFYQALKAAKSNPVKALRNE